MDLQQVALYCDPTLAALETCCEIPGAKVRPATQQLNWHGTQTAWSILISILVFLSKSKLMSVSLFMALFKPRSFSVAKQKTPKKTKLIYGE